MLASGCGGGGGGCTAAVPACNACGRTVDLHNPFLFVQDLEECGCMGGGGYGYGDGGGCGGGGGCGYGGGGGGGCCGNAGGGGCGAAPMCGTPSCAPPSDCNSCCSYCPMSVHWTCSYYNPPYCCPIASCPNTCCAPVCCPDTCSAPACCPGTCSAPAGCGMPSACSAPAMCSMQGAGSQCPADAQGSCCGMPMGGMEQMGCTPAPGPTCPVENSNPFFFIDDLECAGGCGAGNDYNADTLACCGSLYTPLCSVYERKGSIPYGISALCARPMYQLINGSVHTNLNCLRSNGLQDSCELRGRFPPCRPCCG